MGVLVTDDKDQQPAPEGADKVPNFRPRPAFVGTKTETEEAISSCTSIENPGTDCPHRGDESPVSYPRILLMGLPKSGKTSVHKKIFKRQEVKHVVKEDTDIKLKTEDTDVKVKNEDTDVKVKNEDTDIKVKNEDTDIKVKNEDTDIKVKNEDTDVKVKNKDTDVKVKNEDTDVKEKNEDTDVKVKNEDTDVKVKNEDTDVKEKNEDTDVKVKNEDTDVKVKNEDTDVKEKNEDTNGIVEETDGIVKNDVFHFPKLKLQAWDVPWSRDLLIGSYHTWTLYRRAEAIIFVIDAQESEPHIIKALSSFLGVIKNAMSIQAPTRFDLFFHKVDLLTLGQKQELLTGIQALMSRWLTVAQLDHPSINYHLTSVKDNSVFESFSTVAHGVMPQLPVLREMLDSFVMTHVTDTALIADAGSWIIYASHSMPVDKELYTLFQSKSKAILASKEQVFFFHLLDERSLLLVIKLTDKMTLVSVLPKHRCDIFFETFVRQHIVAPKIGQEFGSAQ